MDRKLAHPNISQKMSYVGEFNINAAVGLLFNLSISFYLQI